MTNHTDTSRSGVDTLTAPTLSVVGNFVPPNAVVFFDGDSVIRINRNGTLELGPKWADAGDAAAAFFNELVSRVVPSWNARIEALEAENERLRGVLEVVWKEATTMRNASKLVGPYPKDPASNRVWARSMYHAGKKLHELIKPIRAALGEKQ